MQNKTTLGLRMLQNMTEDKRITPQYSYFWHEFDSNVFLKFYGDSELPKFWQFEYFFRAAAEAPPNPLGSITWFSLRWRKDKRVLKYIF